LTIRVASKRTGAVGEYIGRPSPLGNPFVIGQDGSRAHVIRQYEEWLRQRIASREPAVVNEMNRLWRLAQRGDLTLVCWCAPQACHGDVVKRWLDNRGM